MLDHLIQTWPEADRLAWARAQQAADPFNDPGLAAHWSAASRRSTIRGYTYWLAFLKNRVPEALVHGPAERVTAEHVRAYALSIPVGRSPSTTWNYVCSVHRAVRVMFPAQDWEWLKRHVASLARQVKPRARREHMVSTVRLVDLGIRLMETASIAARSAHLLQEVQYRDGLMIALVALRPLRRGNIADLRLGKTLIETRGEWWIAFEGAATKGKRPSDDPFPEVLAPYLEHYLAAIRPRFPGAARHDGLWASAKGNPLSGNQVYATVCKRTKAAFGKPIYPHLIRAEAATFAADNAPQHRTLARDILHHSRQETTEKYYIRADGRRAAAEYQRSLLLRRQGLKPRSVRPIMRPGGPGTRTDT